jgi:hypothetical protein
MSPDIYASLWRLLVDMKQSSQTISVLMGYSSHTNEALRRTASDFETPAPPYFKPGVDPLPSKPAAAA